jgi:hypothetical protein
MRLKTHTSPPPLLYIVLVKTSPMNHATQNSQKAYSKNEQADWARFAKQPRLCYILAFFPAAAKTSWALADTCLKVRVMFFHQ